MVTKSDHRDIRMGCQWCMLFQRNKKKTFYFRHFTIPPIL